MNEREAKRLILNLLYSQENNKENRCYHEAAEILDNAWEPYVKEEVFVCPRPSDPDCHNNRCPLHYGVI